VGSALYRFRSGKSLTTSATDDSIRRLHALAQAMDE
jgi:hypothetical protein